MLEGLMAAVLGKAWDSTSKLFGKKKDDLESAQLRATATKLVAETTHLETGAQVQRQQLEIASRQALHERIVWFCDPFRAECAKSLQEFATQCSQAFVRVAVMLQANLEPTPELTKLSTECVGKTMDSFANALPYLRGDARGRFGEFLDAIINAVRVVQRHDQETPRRDVAQRLLTAYDALHPELKLLVSPLNMYGAFKEAADQDSGDAGSKGASNEGNK